MVNLRLIFLCIISFLVISPRAVEADTTVGLRCDHFDVKDSKSSVSHDHGAIDQMRGVISETHASDSDHCKGMIKDSRAADHDSQDDNCEPSAYAESPSNREQDPIVRDPESAFNKERVENIQIGNSTITIRELPHTVELSVRAKMLLKSLGLNYMANGIARSSHDERTVALYNWIVYLANCIAELCFEAPTVSMKHAIQQGLTLLNVAHTMLMRGHETIASDLIKLAITAVNKYDAYNRAYLRSAYNRIGSRARRPDMFIREHIEGFCWAMVFTGKIISDLARLGLSQEVRRDFFNAVSRVPEKTNAMVNDILKMSSQEWDAAFLQASKALGEISVDIAIAKGIGYYAPQFFSEINGQVPLYKSAELPGGMGKLAHTIDMVYDPVSKSYIVEQKVASKVMQTTGEVAHKGTASLPSVIGAVEKSGSSFTTKMSSISAVLNNKMVTSEIHDRQHYTFTNTAGNHFMDIVKKGENRGELSRPYMKSTLLIDEIIATGLGIPDESVTTALRFDVPGYFRGVEGTWELVVDVNTKVISFFI